MPGKKAINKSSSKSWQGRLTADADAATSRLVASLDIDIELWRYDIAGSIAHATMLSSIGIITPSELRKIERGLKSIAADLQAGRLELPLELEDIHMVIEKTLIERTGPAGAKLHTGRSRNDQVALDLRMWARDAIKEIIEAARGLQFEFVEFAQRSGETVMPAYTHLQRAQPVLAGQSLLAYVEMLQRDVERLKDSLDRVNVCPLGSGAVAGTSLPLDRKLVARLLGFTHVSRNSIDATSDRDFLAELCFDCSMLAVHLSRWAEDWIIYSTTEFGMIELDDAYCTSSSMMPQKKNPDTLELIRGKTASAIASLTGMLTLLKGLPLAYNRDLQDDKRFVFPLVDAMKQSLAVATGLVATTQIKAQRIAQTIEVGYLDATALAEYLVNKGVPFRQAHHVVGKLVAKASQAGKTLAELGLDELKLASLQIGQDVFATLGTANVVKKYAPEGAGGHKQLKTQISFWREKLAK